MPNWAVFADLRRSFLVLRRSPAGTPSGGGNDACGPHLVQLVADSLTHSDSLAQNNSNDNHCSHTNISSNKKYQW